MTKEDEDKAKQVLLSCAEKLRSVEFKMGIVTAQTLIEIHDGISLVHNLLNKPEEEIKE